MNRVNLKSYDLIEDKHVQLHWEASNELDGVFISTSLSIRFDSTVALNADIAAFTFLSVIVPCYYHSHNSSIEVTFPEHVSQEMIEDLAKYHDLKKVSFINPDSAEINHRRNNIAHSELSDYALFYGGGKDSLLSAAIHEDIYGAENVTLLRLVWDEKLGNLEKKREIISTSLSFMANRGFKFEYVESNFHTIIVDRSIGKIPNIALYPGLMAPLIARKGFKQLSHGYDVGHFHMPANANREMPFKVVRPENLKILANGLSHVTAQPVIFTNFNYGLNAGVAFKYLAKAYPEYLPNIYMCERLSGKWCLKCRKCFLYALACLAYKCESDFNLGYFFHNSQYVKDLVAEIDKSFNEQAIYPNYVYKFAYPTHLCSTVQVAHDIDLNYARDRLWHRKYPEAFLNLVKIIEPYKNMSFPDYDAFWLRAYEEDARELGGDADGATLKTLLKRLEEASIPISTKYTFDGYNRDTPVVYDFRTNRKDEDQSIN